MRKVFIAIVLIVLYSPLLISQENMIFIDDFESYDINTFPKNNWVLHWNGAGNAYQVVVSNPYQSSQKAMQLKSSRSWAVLMYHEIDTNEMDIYNDEIFVECLMKTPASLSQHGGSGSIGLYNKKEGSWGTTYGSISIDGQNGHFYYFTNTNYSETASKSIGNYEFNKWYKLKFKYLLKNSTITIWINDEMVVENQQIIIGNNGKGFNSIALSSGGWGENMFYFDDVKVWTGSVSSNKEVISKYDETISLYPNPAISFLNITNIQQSQSTPLSIFNLYGQKVYDGVMDMPEKEIDVSTLAPGVYFVVVGEQRQMFVKQ